MKGLLSMMTNRQKKQFGPTFAPGMELDNLKEKATPEEIDRGDSTSVTNLILDRTGDDNQG
ncbi:hypothetical protein [Paenibacillus popilliae]|uniref:Uncharacterized protein n=1 Tax=Paenibacillus popilliae ATCC 14706 TaxID=1212764 RepID=M9LQM7_PAEPP|nr:hypothetical protein [Paenibacillus popilliae]GAC43251.1 hypothetical protein PPOP_2618 [Paenibacillus popilliae ATCC 14706]